MLGQETGAAFSLKSVGFAARCSHFSSRLVMSSMMSGLLDFLMMALMACLSAVLEGVVRSSALVLSRGRMGHFQGVLGLGSSCISPEHSLRPGQLGLLVSSLPERSCSFDVGKMSTTYVRVTPLLAVEDLLT
jgi:hypothetical protein